MRRAIRSFACAVAASRRCAPLPSRLPRTASSPRSRTARLVALNPDGSGLRTLLVAATAEQITELAWSPDGNRLAFVTAGEIGVLDLADGRGRDRSPTGARATRTRLVGGRHADRLPARAC